MDMETLKREIEEIKLRNQRVEGDKAWETSLFRKITISLITYIVAAIVMYFIGVQDYFLSALIPTIGYFLSTLSLSFIKRWWINKSLI